MVLATFAETKVARPPGRNPATSINLCIPSNNLKTLYVFTLTPTLSLKGRGSTERSDLRIKFVI